MNTFVVDKILKHRGAPGAYEYLVQWKQYSDEHNSWEPQSSFNDTNCITKYWSSLKQ
jgi:chromobox protein 5